MELFHKNELIDKVDDLKASLDILDEKSFVTLMTNMYVYEINDGKNE